jgi:hypothetical protein
VAGDKMKTNDYILKYGNEFAWLYTGCSYSSVRFKELTENLERDLSLSDKDAAATCPCEGPCKHFIKVK